MVFHKRRIKLIKPRLQFKLILTFLGLLALSLSLQFLVFLRGLTILATELPQDHEAMMDAVPEMVVQTLLLSFGILLPLVLLVGVLVTFRIAGPIYRFEVHLKSLIDGQNAAECRIRKGDELHELCALLNEATADLRARNATQLAAAETSKQAA